MISVHKLDCDCGKCVWMEKREHGRTYRFKGLKTRTRVVHCRREDYDVYIGRVVHRKGLRLQASKWGNPFKLQPGESREAAIAKYREWLLQQPHLLASLHELRGKVLGCWCSPQKCHGDVLAELADALPLETKRCD